MHTKVRKSIKYGRVLNIAIKYDNLKKKFYLLCLLYNK